MERNKMFTRTRLRQVLRANGCLRSRDHIKGCEAAGKLLRCYLAHPPTAADEEMETQSWYLRVPTPTRRLMKVNWGQLLGHNGRAKVTGETPVFSPRVAEGVKEFAYTSTVAVMRKNINETLT